MCSVVYVPSSFFNDPWIASDIPCEMYCTQSMELKGDHSFEISRKIKTVNLKKQICKYT